MGNKPFSYERIFGVRFKTADEVYQQFCSSYVQNLETIYAQSFSENFEVHNIREAEKTLFALTDLVVK